MLKRITLSVISLALFSGINFASAEESHLIKVVYTTIDNPVISSESAKINFVAHVKYEDGTLDLSKLSCINGAAESLPAIVSQISNTEFTITCSINMDQNLESSLRFISFSSMQNGTDGRVINFIPDSAMLNFTNTAKDSFGTESTMQQLAYTSGPKFNFGTYIAIRPTGTYSFPKFKKTQEGYIIFDSRNSTSSKIQILIDKKKKMFGYKCPDQNLPTPLINTQTSELSTLYADGKIVSRSSSKYSYLANHSYINTKFRGKNVIFTCTVTQTWPGPNQPFGPLLAYTESIPTSYKFPMN